MVLCAKCFFGFLLPCFLWLQNSYAQDEVLFRGAGHGHFYVEAYGQFNNQSRWDINLVNAPAEAFTKKPADMDIPKETLKLLNGKYEAVFQKVFNFFHLKTTWEESDYKDWKKNAQPILDGDGDRYFHIQIFIGGYNGMGGNYGGLDLRMKLMSFHRRADLVYGYAMTTLSVGNSAEENLSRLQKSFTQLLKEASDDWMRALENEKTKPRKSLDLTFDLDRLNREQKNYVREVLIPCLLDQASLLQYTFLSQNEMTYRLDYRLKRYDENETEEDYLRHCADHLLFSMGNYGKYPCSLWRTPLEGYKAKVQVEVQKKLITIRWNKP